MKPWDVLLINGTRRAFVHVGVVHAWRRVANEAGISLEIPLGALGAARTVALVEQLGALQDHIENREEVAWMAIGASNTALGEWSSGPVDVTGRGVLFHGWKVRGWDGARMAVGEETRDTPWELLRFSSRAKVVGTSQSGAWGHHLTAVQRALADASFTVSVECVTLG